MLQNGVVTIFVLDAEGENYVKKGVFPAWMHSKKRLRTNSVGVYLRDNFDVRIGLDCLDEVSVGDLVFFGEMSEADLDVARCGRIAAVGRNDFGSQPHWHLQAEYEYR